MKLHLGCGKRHIPGFIHIDLADFPHIDYHSDIADLSFIDNDSVSLIYACQVLTYFDRETIPEVLGEWRRVLKTGGILRLSVPNFATLCKLYNAGLSLDFFLGTLYGKWQVRGADTLYHKTTFDAPSLKKLLEDNGYKNCELWDWRTTEHSHIDDFSQAYFPHMDKEKGVLFNLNMQAGKA
ncbi:MAG: methyltransferase [Proteobacteria bacterium]|nr:MAG: methyltransferase [Pseudomonadota bacterium]